MESRADIDDFNKELKTLIENVRLGIKDIEQTKLGINPNQISPLGQILSEITIADIEINSLSEISDPRIKKENIILFLTYEMKFINSKNPYPTETSLTQSKWWKAVKVVSESIGNYFKIPYGDIIQEIIKLGAIITE